MAVEDSAKPAPNTSAAAGELSNKEAMPAINAPVTTTCAAPSPNTIRRIDHSRSTESSSPIMNSRNTIPSSASARTPSRSAITTYSSQGKVSAKRATP